MRSEYEFEGVGGRYLVKDPGIVFEDRTIGLIVNENNPLAAELLKMARILDGYDELASALLLDWPRSLEALHGRDGEGFIFKAKLQRLLGRHTVVVERRGEGETA